MAIRNLTVFSHVELKFGRNLNVLVGENGTGKTHLLKMAYSVLAASWEEGSKPNDPLPAKSVLQSRLARKLVNVFRPETLGRLTRRQSGRARCDVSILCRPSMGPLSFSFAANSQKEVVLDRVRRQWIEPPPVFFPTRELLTLYPNFVSVYDSHYLEFEETWRDTCQLLGAPLSRDTGAATDILSALEEAMRGKIELDSNGRFYLRGEQGRIEMPLVAEGMRKFGMLARLIANGTLLKQGCLFWDEPEANLNPALIARLAEIIVMLGASGVQVFLATHSLFLLRELELLLERRKGENYEARFFGLHFSDQGVTVEQGASVNDIGDIRSLDEELNQSNRFLTTERPAA